MTKKYLLLGIIFIAFIAAIAVAGVALQRPPEPPPASAFAKRTRPHFDHAPVTPSSFAPHPALDGTET